MLLVPSLARKVPLETHSKAIELIMEHSNGEFAPGKA
jgi:hypothetical protein